MKNKTLKTIVCTAVMALLLSVTACGGSDGGANAQEVGAENGEDTAEAEPTASSAIEDTESEAEEEEAGFKTLEDYFNDPSGKSELEAIIENSSSEWMTLSIEVKENALTYIFKIEDSSMVTDDYGDLLAAQMEEQKGTFGLLAAGLDEEIGQSGACTVRVRYLDPDGNVLAEREYTAADKVEEADVSADTKSDAAEGTENASYETLEDYYNDPSVKSALDAQFAGVSEEGMSASLEVKGNVFTVTVKIEDSSMVVDGLGDALAAALESQRETFKTYVAQFDEVVGESGACTVVMRYTDPDDNVLAETEFKGQ
ncbi:MAG: DUF4854 domain-containing protein [Clostridium sp.]|nr:DUF4854 domain-containing protein [Clostridium sp.]